MPYPVVRITVDHTAGHSCYPPTVFTKGSPNVRANNIPVVRQGDPIKPHCCPDSCHGGSAVGNSCSVFVNNRPVQHVINGVTCGDTSAQGSPNTFSC